MFEAIGGTLVLLDLWCWWRMDRRLRDQPRLGLGRLLLGIFFTMQLGGVSWFLWKWATHWSALLTMPRLLAVAVLLWHLLVLPVFVLCDALGSAVIFFGRILRSSGPRKSETMRPAETEMKLLSRRQFIGAVTVAAPPLVNVLMTGVAWSHLNDFRVRRLVVNLPELPVELDGLTIAQVSDAHVGRFTRGPVLERIAEVTNQLEADLVVLTGDLINDSLRDLPAALEMVGKMKSRYGVFLCEGNHDLIDDALEFRRRVKAAGFSLLVNEARTVSVRGTALRIIGTRWTGALQGAHRPDASARDFHNLVQKEIAELLEPGLFPLVLTHHPHAWDAARRVGIPLTLAGHTHGGQLMLSENIGFGPVLFHYWSGLYYQNGKALMVSNGVGNWFPLRIHAPAEIVHLTLKNGVIS